MSSNCEFALVFDTGNSGLEIANALGNSSYQWSALKGWTVCVPEPCAIPSGRMAVKFPFDAVYIVGSEDSGYFCQIYKAKRCLYSTVADSTGDLPSRDISMFYTCLAEISGAKIRKLLERSELDGCSNVFQLFFRLGFHADQSLSFENIRTERDIYPQYSLYEPTNVQTLSTFIVASEIQAFGTMFVLESEVKLDFLVEFIALDAVKKTSTVRLDELLNHETNSIGFMSLKGRTVGFDIIGFEKCSEDWIDKLSSLGKLYVFFFNKYDRESELIVFSGEEEQERCYFKNGELLDYSCLTEDSCLIKQLPKNSITMPTILDYIDANIFRQQEFLEFTEYCY